MIKFVSVSKSNTCITHCVLLFSGRARRSLCFVIVFYESKAHRVGNFIKNITPDFVLISSKRRTREI